MIDRVFGIKVRMSGLSINRIGRLLSADYRPANNRPLPYRCISNTDQQISEKRSIFADEMYSTICVEWTIDHFGLSLM